MAVKPWPWCKATGDSVLEISPYIVIAWIGVTLLLFLLLSRPVAVIVSCLVGSMFLPEIQWSPIPPNNALPIRFPPFDFTKINSISYGLLLGWLVCDRGRIRHIRWNRWDLPAIILGVYPAVVCLLVGQSVKDAFSALRFSMLQWTVPYCIGRLYLFDAAGCRRVIVALAIGALVYVPFCLLELRIAPQLHYMVYGFQQHSFLQVTRSWGYRPMVFMQHGLAVALFMWLGVLSLFWMLRSRVWPSDAAATVLHRFSELMVLLLGGTAVLCKSFGATVLGIAGIGTLFVSEKLRLNILWIALIVILPIYMTGRIAGWLRADTVIAAMGGRFEQDRADSFEFRIINEEKFMSAMSGLRRWTGMGNDPAIRPMDHNAQPLIIDGQWMIEYFNNGVIGVVALAALFLLPAVRFLWQHPPEGWATPAVAPAAVAAMASVLLAIDCIPNAMLNPFDMLIVAALNGWNNGIADVRRAMFGSAQVTA
jgi:hypothetical protein